MHKAQVFEALATTGQNIVISGEAGDSLLAQLIDNTLIGGEKKGKK